MKHILFLSFVLTTLMLSNATYAQNKKEPFEGTLTYNVTYTSETPVPPAFLAVMPATITYKAKGNKTFCSALTLGGALAECDIFDSDAKKIFFIIKQMDSTIVIVQSLEEMQKMADSISKNAPKPSFKKLNGTKVIAGYACKTGLYTHTNPDSLNSLTTDTLWYNENLYLPGIMMIQDIAFHQIVPGFVVDSYLYLSNTIYNKHNFLKQTQRIKEIKKEKIPDSVFELPKGVKVMTMREYKEFKKKNSEKDEDKK